MAAKESMICFWIKRRSRTGQIVSGSQRIVTYISCIIALIYRCKDTRKALVLQEVWCSVAIDLAIDDGLFRA